MLKIPHSFRDWLNSEPLSSTDTSEKVLLWFSSRHPSWSLSASFLILPSSCPPSILYEPVSWILFSSFYVLFLHFCKEHSAVASGEKTCGRQYFLRPGLSENTLWYPCTQWPLGLVRSQSHFPQHFQGITASFLALHAAIEMPDALISSP